MAHIYIYMYKTYKNNTIQTWSIHIHWTEIRHGQAFSD